MRNPTPPKPWAPSKDGTLVWTCRYQFLTYVIGGGVEQTDHHKHFDPVTPVRGASVRSQLRFWWRATNPNGFSTLRELSEAEGKLFGSTHRGGALRLRVTEQPGDPEPVAFLEGKFNAVAGYEGYDYGGFPLRDPLGKDHGKLWDYGESPFELEFSFPESLKKDMEAALWAWSRFGGLGARTRRGFGAVAQIESPMASGDGLVAGIDVPWPHLTDKGWVAEQSGAASKDVHRSLLKSFQRLRQGGGLGRDGERSYGRSNWPEPDALRRISGRAAYKFSTPKTNVDRFPRARFGLPIIFEFKDAGGGDPDKSTLSPRVKGARKDRFASPLIFRPRRSETRLPAGYRGGGTSVRYRASAVILAGPQPDELELDFGSDARPHLVQSELSAADVAALATQTGGRNLWGTRQTDVLKRFTELLQEEDSR